ncbi:MAG: hypothetical protein L6R38_003714 [Xanthoria sp. 2 TBL-2021]|nr:MAG: hypothetical protein L6R38_003714 [Xanthoria sp. 2 TBL-2021]
MPSVPTPGTKSGIITSTSGERHIPASVRPDGSTRKEIKIRPGYKPPEDVEVYKNRTAEAWKTKGVGARVPGAEVIGNDEVKSTSNKNAKRREARKRAKEAGEGVQSSADGGDEGAQNLECTPVKQNLPGKQVALEKGDWRKQDQEVANTLDPEAEKEKQARNLKKKLRQARELREKKDNGENLLPEQFAKVIKINELIRQLDSLGFDAEGERKDQ